MEQEETFNEQLKVFGCATYAQRLDDKRTKLDAKNAKCAFVMYNVDSKAYRLIEESNGKLMQRCGF